MKKFNSTEKYIIGESPEIAVGERIGWPERIKNAFPAFRSRNYKLYFTGQLVSSIGTWLQNVAQGWLVLKLTNSPFQIGLVGVAGSLPSLLFSLFGGVIVDRFKKQIILQFTQTASLILAFVLGLLAISNHIQVWQVALLAFILGTVGAIDSPARQSFVVEMVGKEDLSSAIALNSGMFNTARVIGPSIAGYLIAIIGVGGAFMLNALSYVAAIVAISLMRVQPVVALTHPRPWKAVKEGVSYSLSHPVIRTLLIYTGILSIFGWSYATIMPYVAEHTFGFNASGLGSLYAAIGLGSLTAALGVSAFAKNLNPFLVIVGGNFIFAVSLFIFTFTHTFLQAFPVLFLMGFGLLAQSSLMNSTIQHLVKDEYRGRVMSLYIMMFLGMFPLGNFEIGFLSDYFNPQIALRVGAVIVLLAGISLFIYRKRLERLRVLYNLD